MQAPLDHLPIPQEKFLGLYSRGDTVPNNFFSDCLNVKYNEDEVSTRDGSVIALTATTIVRFFKYKRLGETPRFIYLKSNGDLFDSLFPNNPIWSDAAFGDFSLVNYNNRAYITPHDRTRGLAGKFLLVYDGSGTARLAGGAAPSGFTLGVANSATAGTVEEGIHLIAVAYITPSGFITAPGPAVFTAISAPGDKKLDISAIPVGPALSTTGRIILATKSIPASLYTGNQFGYEFFFVPNGTILNNTATTLAIDFYDSDLINSADYLLDNLVNIPAGLGLVVFNARLCSWAANGEEHTLRASVAYSPETFSSVDGLLTVDPSEAVSGIRNAAEFRKNLVLLKSNRIYGTSDNNDSPSTWQVSVLDKAAGTECFGVANVLDARGTNTDRLFLADRSGLLNFEGYIRRPELSYNIEDIWKRINKAKFNLVQVIDDPVNHRFYVTVPLDAAVVISHILFADYSKAFTVYGTIDEKAIKWAIWTFPTAVKSIVGDADDTTFSPVVHVLLTDGIHNVKSGLTLDNGTAIDSFVESSNKTTLLDWIQHFSGIKLRVRGFGNLQVTLSSQDGARVVTLTNPIPLSIVNGQDPYKGINFTSENMTVKLRVSNANEYFILNRLTVWAKALWLRRPS